MTGATPISFVKIHVYDSANKIDTRGLLHNKFCNDLFTKS